MANKTYSLDKGFLLHRDWNAAFKMLTNEEAGILIKACISRQEENIPFPKFEAPTLQMAAMMIEPVIQRRLDGQKGGRKTQETKQLPLDTTPSTFSREEKRREDITTTTTTDSTTTISNNSFLCSNGYAQEKAEDALESMCGFQGNVEGKPVGYYGITEDEEKWIVEYFIENEFKSNPREFIAYNASRGWRGIGGENVRAHLLRYMIKWERGEK